MELLTIDAANDFINVYAFIWWSAWKHNVKIVAVRQSD